MTKEQMIQRFRVKNIEVLNQFEKENRSIFLMCGHYASWEWMMSLGYHIKHCGYGIYRPISNPYFDSLINRIRSRHNAYMIPQKKVSKIKKNTVFQGRVQVVRNLHILGGELAF